MLFDKLRANGVNGSPHKDKEKTLIAEAQSTRSYAEQML
jgi:hypothetical protein